MKNQNSLTHKFLCIRKTKTFNLIVLLFCFSLFITFPSNTSAQQLAKGLDKFLGAGTSSDIWRNFAKYWNQVSPGNDGKWGSVESVQGTYNWTNLDKIYNFAKTNNLIFKEHTLLWGSQQPSWISTLDSAQQRAAVENWIKAFGERYPSVAIIDVVNEPFNSQPSYKNALGGNGTTGWDWVITAFELARKYCPSGAKLIINEYNILQDYNTTNRYATVIKLLKDRGLIDGIGIQGHYFEFRSHTDATSGTYVYSAATLKANLNILAALGLPIYITEFDIDEQSSASQLAQYQIYFPVFWTNPAVKGITLWGYIQSDVWSSHPYTYLMISSGAERSALQWLREYVLKPIQPVIISPVGTKDEMRDPLLAWHPSFSATSYRVQLSTDRAFATVDIDSVVTDTTFQVSPLTALTTYFWRVRAINDKGESEYTTTAFFTTGEKTVDVEQTSTKPTDFALFQNYPNPFNPTTKISFNLPQRSEVSLVLLDVLGRQVADIVSGYYEAGLHTIDLNASKLSSGIYFYRIVAGNFVASKKLIVLK